MIDETAVGGKLILEGKSWTIASIEGAKCMATCTVVVSRPTEEDSAGLSERVQRLLCDAREVEPMGDGLYTLPGRLEFKRPNRGAVVAGVAVGTAGAI